MSSDLKYAARSLLKVPGFFAVSVLIIAVGIGAITAVFSTVEAVLLRPLPYAHPDELFSLHSAEPTEGGLFSLPEYCAFRDQNASFSALSAVGSFNTSMMAGTESRLVQGLRISANSFDMLRVRPAAGRMLVPDDDRPGAAQVVVLGYSLWQRSFGGSPGAVGQTVQIDGRPYGVVGVLPRGFVLPINGFHDDVCVPLQPDADPMRYEHGSLHYLQVIGRIAPELSTARATDDLNSVLGGLRKQYPKDYAGSSPLVMRMLDEQIVGDSRPVLVDLFCVVGALLLLASANLAGLHLVRAIGRHHDFALRSALGASRGQLLRLVLAECLILSVVGGLAGMVLANWGMASLLALVPVTFPRIQDVSFNGTVFAFAAATSLVFGLAPAFAPILLASRSDLRGAVASGGSRTVGGHTRIRAVLASVQVAVALALLACTALFLRSFWAAGAQQLGFDTSNAVSVRLTLPQTGYTDEAALIRHTRQLQERLGAIPGVEDVSATSLLPLASGLATAQFTLAGETPPPDAKTPSANYRLVLPRYFETMRIPIREGRTFDGRDDASRPLVVVVGAALANAFFPRHDAVGRSINIQDTATGFRKALIVGVAGDVKQAKIEDAPSFDVYVPYRQMTPVAVLWLRYRTFWIVRGTAPAAALEGAIRREVRAADPAIALSAMRTLGEVSESALAGRRFTLLVIGFFAGTALLLTIAGIYSVVAFGVAQRTREIGVRLALGARAGQIFGLVLREGLVIVALGAAAGLVITFLLSELVAAQLYGVGPHDPGALAASILMVALITFLACWVPARRAARVDPIIALRSE